MNHKGQIDGILNLHKPYGVTSMEVVRRVKRASGQRRVGHSGTLDPVATGVMAVCMGQATRMMEYVVDSIKEYRTVVELGVNTDTYDSQGKVIKIESTSNVTLTDIERALESFKGTIQQVPPMYSALKQKGKRLYDLARVGIEVERKPRTVEVYAIDVVGLSLPHLTLEVRCGRGFYVRSLAYDLGKVLNCGGHLKSLIRLRSGPFHTSDSILLPDMEEKFSDGTWGDVIYAPDVVLHKMPAAVVSRQLENMIRNGKAIDTRLGLPTSEIHAQCRVYSVDGRFLAVLNFDSISKCWRPHKVFSLR